jgi:hypothetical protein
VARIKAFSHVILKVFSGLFPFFVEMVSHQCIAHRLLSLMSARHRNKHSPEFRVPLHVAKRNGACEPNTPDAFNTIVTVLAWALEAMLELELAFESMYASV